MNKLFIDGIEQEIKSLKVTFQSSIDGSAPAIVVDALSIQVPPELPPEEPPVIEEPLPEEPLPEEPEPELPPVEPPPAEEPPVQGANILSDLSAIAENMNYGDWLDLSNLTTIPIEWEDIHAMQYLQDSDGWGWTRRMIFDAEHGIVIFGARGNQLQTVCHMDKYGNWKRYDFPDGYMATGKDDGGRRTYDRLFRAGDYLYFALAYDVKTDMGPMARAPLSNPTAFELVYPPFNDSQVLDQGAWTVLAVEEWNRVYAYLPGAKVYSREIDDLESPWYYHGHMPRDTNGVRASGIAGSMVWNHITKKLLFVGGQEFGDNPETAYKVYQMSAPLGPLEMLADRLYPDNTEGVPDNTPHIWSSAQDKCFVLSDGSYAYYRHNTPGGNTPWRRFFRSITGGGKMHPYFTMPDTKPWGSYEAYAPYNLLSGTDAYVYVSHRKGLGMVKFPPLDGLPTEPEKDPILMPVVDPDAPPPIPPPSGDASFEEIAAATQPGTMNSVRGFTYPGYPDFQTYWNDGTYHTNKDTFQPKGFWDGSWQDIIYAGGRTPNDQPVNLTMINHYSSVTNNWAKGDMSTLLDPAYGLPHPYGAQAYDEDNWHLYFNPNSTEIPRYLVNEDRWEVINVTSPLLVRHIGPCAFLPGLGLVRPQAQESNPHLMIWQPGSPAWEDYGPMPFDGYQSHLCENPVRNDILSLGGTSNRSQVTIITSDGKMVSKKPVPTGDDGLPIFKTNINYGNLFYDPITGNYLYKAEDHRLWEYSPDLDEWRLAIDFALPENEYMIPGNFFGWVMVPINEMGVIARMTYWGLDIYRHKSVFV